MTEEYLVIEVSKARAFTGHERYRFLELLADDWFYNISNFVRVDEDGACFRISIPRCEIAYRLKQNLEDNVKTQLIEDWQEYNATPALFGSQARIGRVSQETKTGLATTETIQTGTCTNQECDHHGFNANPHYVDVVDEHHFQCCCGFKIPLNHTIVRASWNTERLLESLVA